LRTHEELLAEIRLRKELGLPRIELTPEEKVRAFGDVEWAKRNPNSRIETMCQRYKDGLPLSISDVKEVKKYLRGK
jgi:hypothetical protein